MSTPTEVEIQSLMDTAEREPWEFYDRLLDGRDGIWDEGAQAWLFSSYASCKQILRTDKRMFRHPAGDAAEDDDYRKLAGRAQPKFMPPEQHSKMHHWWMAQFHPNVIERLRTSLIRPLVSRNLERIAGRGRAELAGEFVERIPVRVIAGVMGLPYEDDALIDHFKLLLEVKTQYFNRVRATHGGPVPASEEEQAAIIARMYEVQAELHEMLGPTIEARRVDPQDDLISRMWADGPTLLDGWNEADMHAEVFHIFSTGTDTATHAICNALYMLMTRPEVTQEVRSGGDDAVAAFTEEVLRLAGSVHFRPRISNADQEISGCPIKKDDRVITVNLAANRDPARYERPLEIDLRRPSRQDHMAFNFGPHYCVGAPLARAEIQESVRAVLGRLGDLRLDPDADPPHFGGFLLRSYRPLNALFSPSLNQPA